MAAPQAVHRRRDLTTDDFVAAALEIARTDGLSELSMRRIGAELGVSAMALYKHFPDKDALVSALVDEVMGRVELVPSPAPGTWQGWVESVALSVWHLLCAYPGLADEVLVRAPIEPLPNAQRVVAAGLRALVAAGFAEDVAAEGFMTFLCYITGQVRLRGLTPTTDEDARFVRGLRTILRGLSAELAAPTRQRRQ